MKRTGLVNLPLHYGNAPRWLFSRMMKLGGEIAEAIVDEYGTDEFLARISNPFWFQAFGNVLGFDWHSSGLTTTVCGALKESLKEKNLGIFVAGGKGKAIRKTPEEIEKAPLSENKIEKLKYASRMSAKVDSCLIQDGFELYHHCLFFSESGKWATVQQGMNPDSRYARRYHWLSENVVDFIEEPHSAICSDKKEENVLDMTAKESRDARKVSLDLVKEKPINLEKYQKTLHEFFYSKKTKILTLPKHHPIVINKRTMVALAKAYEINPKNYEELVSIQGIGKNSIRALALISEIIYGKSPSWKDPAKYSFAHGGKDGYPYPVNRMVYDKSIDILKEAIENSKIGHKQRIEAIKRLNFFINS